MAYHEAHIDKGSVGLETKSSTNIKTVLILNWGFISYIKFGYIIITKQVKFIIFRFNLWVRFHFTAWFLLPSVTISMYHTVWISLDQVKGKMFLKSVPESVGAKWDDNHWMHLQLILSFTGISGQSDFRTTNYSVDWQCGFIYVKRSLFLSWSDRWWNWFLFDRLDFLFNISFRIFKKFWSVELRTEAGDDIRSSIHNPKIIL